MTRLRAAVVAAGLVVTAVPAAGSEGATAPAAPRRLVFVGSDSLPPYQYNDGAGQPAGFNVELMRALARETGIDIAVRLVGHGTARTLVERGEADLLCLGFTEARAHRYTWLLPLWRLRQVMLFVREPGVDVRTLGDVAGRKVLIGRGSLAWEELHALPPEKRPQAVEFPDNKFIDGAARLRNGEAELMVANALPLRHQRVYLRYPELKERTYRSIPYYLAAARGREDLQPIFFAAFTRLQETGEFNAIAERTLLKEPADAARDRWVLYALGMFAAGIAALFVVTAWNRALRSQVEARTGELRAVAERLELHGLVQAQVSDAIVVVNTDRCITMWNAGAEALFGMPASRALGSSSQILTAMAGMDTDAAAIRAEVERSGRWRGEARIRRADGTELHVHATVKVLQNPDGTADGHLIVVHDIDALKRAEQERLKLELQMQHVQKLESLGVLAGGIAHDFNNLLVGVLGHAGLALADLPPDSPARERVRQIETCAIRAAELTNQMLAYSGKGRFVVQPTDVSAIVREMANLLQAAVNKNARLELQLAPKLPAVLADVAQLRQVVMNLITNASEALGDRPGTVTVVTGVMHASRAYLAQAYVAAAEPGAYVYIEVRDDGCGMDAETKQRIFEPFFTTKVSGRGLGLAAVIGIVRGHRGAVQLESSPGSGTTFRILFPASAAEAVDRPGHAEPAHARNHARVLVVDDEPAVRMIAAEALKRAGFEVVVAADGHAAVSHVRDGAPVDAVLLDMTMPGLSGLETLRAIHNVVRGIPVVLTSGYPEQESAERCNGEVVAGFIQKPFAPAALVAKINEALASGVRA